MPPGRAWRASCGIRGRPTNSCWWTTARPTAPRPTWPKSQPASGRSGWPSCARRRTSATRPASTAALAEAKGRLRRPAEQRRRSGTAGWLDGLVAWSLHDWPRVGLVGPVTDNAPRPPARPPRLRPTSTPSRRPGGSAFRRQGASHAAPDRLLPARPPGRAGAGRRPGRAVRRRLLRGRRPVRPGPPGRLPPPRRAGRVRPPRRLPDRQGAGPRRARGCCGRTSASSGRSGGDVEAAPYRLPGGRAPDAPRPPQRPCRRRRGGGPRCRRR